MATIRNRVSIYSHLLSNCSNDRFGIKKVYQKPTTNVVKLQHKTHILAGSIQTLQGPNASGTGSEESDWYDLE